MSHFLWKNAPITDVNVDQNYVAFFRRDVVYFGIDEYGDSLLTYYKVTYYTFYIFSDIIF